MKVNMLIEANKEDNERKKYEELKKKFENY